MCLGFLDCLLSADVRLKLHPYSFALPKPLSSVQGNLHLTDINRQHKDRESRIIQ